MPPKLILASSSPRRRELLAAAGYDFEVCPPAEQAECGVCSRESPAARVARLAYQKAADVFARRFPSLLPQASSLKPQASPAFLLACDTLAECDGQTLGKPPSVLLARRMLELLSGREHRVLSGVCLWPLPHGRPLIRVAVTTLRMDPLSEPQLAAYLESGQWEGKAGAFGYQDGLDWLHVLSGSESNVVGLPLELLAEMLKESAISSSE